jgi:hypothetical protein
MTPCIVHEPFPVANHAYRIRVRVFLFFHESRVMGAPMAMYLRRVDDA